MSRITRKIAGMALAGSLITAAAGVLPAVAANAAVRSPAVVSCKTTHTDRLSTSSTGTTHTVTTKTGCGKNYREWETIDHAGITGSHYHETVTKIETYPHWWKRAVKVAVSAKGKTTTTVTVSTG